MVAVQIVLHVVHGILVAYLVLLWARVILDLVQVIARDWRPHGVALVVAEIVYTLTDPPVKALRRTLPPLRIGPVALDLSILILMLATIVLMSIVSAFLPR